MLLKIENAYKNRFLRTPGLLTSSKNAEKSDLSDGINDISPNHQKTMKTNENHSKKKTEKNKNLSTKS